ncbi:EscJ/YscJ/HrcJ family type III secretion inner membrane ring protein, partial [Pseudomonas ogarae]
MKPGVLLLLLCLALVGCRQPNLLEGLDQQQANEVLSVLQRNNIAAVKVDTGKTGYAVKIDALDFSAAVDLLNLYSLPSRPRLQVAEMFPSDSLVASPRAEKARLYSALEQRIEQSLAVLEGVVSARVHVSYDLEAGEGGRKPPPVHLSA